MWVKRCPNPHKGESEIEIRQIFTAEELGEGFTPELREQRNRISLVGARPLVPVRRPEETS